MKKQSKYAVVAVAALLLTGCASGAASTAPEESVATDSRRPIPTTTATPTPTVNPWTAADDDGDGVPNGTDWAPQDPSMTSSPAPSSPAPTDDAPTAQADAPSQATTSQRQAARAAQQYLETMAFSRQGLIDQLSSEYGSQFAVADATWAVDQLTVDWNEQAARAARQYLESMAFSRQGLIDQLSSEYGSKFTVAQATYGVNAVGL